MNQRRKDGKRKTKVGFEKKEKRKTALDKSISPSPFSTGIRFILIKNLSGEISIEQNHHLFIQRCSFFRAEGNNQLISTAEDGGDKLLHYLKLRSKQAPS